MDQAARIEALETQNDVLRERVRLLEDALMETATLPFEWRLTATEARVFGVLVNRVQPSKEAIMCGLYTDLGADEAEIKIVDVLICKLRKKVEPFGIRIHTVWGQGYRLDEEVRRRFQKVQEPAR